MEAVGLIRKRVADVAAYDRFYKKFIAQVVVSEISASFVMEDIKDIRRCRYDGAVRACSWRRK